MAIDVGATAINRASGWPRNNTLIGLDNPANATGTVDTAEIWMLNATTDMRVGTFFLVSGTTYQCRDNETIGSVASGSKQTFTGLTVDIQITDLWGCYYSLPGNPVPATIERDTTGFAGVYAVAGEYIDTGDQASYTLVADDALSLYGTGTEAGGGGSTYEESCSDGFKGGDSNTANLTIGLTVTDGFKGGDSNPNNVSFFNTLTDGLNMGDSDSAGLSYDITLTDGMKMGDTRPRWGYVHGDTGQRGSRFKRPNEGIVQRPPWRRR